MRVVGIDLETTGLIAADSEIIEVAAIAFDTTTGEETDRFVYLCGTSRPLSPQITAITGISPDMIAQQPPFASSKDKLIEFIGQDTIFAHNASFDLAHLQAHGVTLTNPVWDTFWLATVAWPSAATYNLGSLVEDLGVPSAGEHRAAHDVVMSWQLLRQMAGHLSVPRQWLAAIKTILTTSQLDDYQSLFTLQSTARRQKNSRKEPVTTTTINDTTTPMADIFGKDGYLHQNKANFEPRSEQVAMADAVASTLHDNHVALIEAGTGIGKTYAYVVAALLWQRQSPATRKVLISTFTRNLQDQLLQRDLPDLLSHFGGDSTCSALKGRSNYICSQALESFIGRSDITTEEGWLLLKVLVWLAHQGSGDSDQLNISHQHSTTLRQLSAASLTCRTQCRLDKPVGVFGPCAYHLARQQATVSDIIITNHALLVSLRGDAIVARGESALIIDEAHHVIDVARSSSQVHLSADFVHQLLTAVSHYAATIRSSHPAIAQHITQEVDLLLPGYQQLLAALADCMHSITADSLLRLTPTVRRGHKWQIVRRSAEHWESKLSFVLGLVKSSVPTAKNKGYDQVQKISDDCQQFLAHLQRYIAGDSTRVQWCDMPPTDGPAAGGLSAPIHLHDVALSTQDLLLPLFSQFSSVILTSATLTIAGSFEYIKRNIGLDTAKAVTRPCTELVITSQSFNYQDQMLIYIVEDAYPPLHEGFLKQLVLSIHGIASLLVGRLLVLFTSKKMLKAAHYSTFDSLYKENTKLLSQGMTGSRPNLIRRFAHHRGQVLFGTLSFWEGVDIPGDALSCVIIPKLPFGLPHDPVVAALGEITGGNVFRSWALPNMILKLRQGVGRLIRTSSDKGVVVIFDSRFLRQSYRSDVLKSLPPATIQIGSHSELLPAVKNWFGAEVIQQWQRKKSATDQ